MLPDPEINAFLMTVDDAVGFAAEGQLADGYAVLVAGLRRAEEAPDAGEPWADELVQRYQLAIDNYVASYGVSLQ
jgi:hypothetical protein